MGGGAPLIVGGDFNLKQPELDGLTRVASHWVDHMFAPGAAAGRGEVFDAGSLSDHKPLAVIWSDAHRMCAADRETAARTDHRRAVRPSLIAGTFP